VDKKTYLHGAFRLASARYMLTKPAPFHVPALSRHSSPSVTLCKKFRLVIERLEGIGNHSDVFDAQKKGDSEPKSRHHTPSTKLELSSPHMQTREAVAHAPGELRITQAGS
jgi:hypothetical protein